MIEKLYGVGTATMLGYGLMVVAGIASLCGLIWVLSLLVAELGIQIRSQLMNGFAIIADGVTFRPVWRRFMLDLRNRYQRGEFEHTDDKEREKVRLALVRHFGHHKQWPPPVDDRPVEMASAGVLDDVETEKANG